MTRADALGVGPGRFEEVKDGQSMGIGIGWERFGLEINV